MKLTEDKVVALLIKYLKAKGWTIDDHRLSHQRGIDIQASRKEKRLLIEVKGARAHDKAHNKVRQYFDCGQIKSHFGRALVKVLSLKHEQPGAAVAIAHPDDPDIRRHIGKLVPYLKPLNTAHFWVGERGVEIE